MVGPKLGTARSSLTLPSSSPPPHKQSKAHRPGAPRLQGQPLADSDLANGAEDISELGSGKRKLPREVGPESERKARGCREGPPRAVPPAITLVVRADGRRSIRVAPLRHASSSRLANCWLGKFMNRNLFVQESRQSVTTPGCYLSLGCNPVELLGSFGELRGGH